MLEFDIRFDGIDEMNNTFDKLTNEVIQELLASVDDSGEHLLTQSQKLAPKLKGDLEASGDKRPARLDGDEIVCSIHFSGLPYIERRHEEDYTPGLITAGKPWVDGMKPGRKFMENPLIYYKNKYVNDWRETLRRVLSA